MPIPYVYECNESMSYASSAKNDIVEALAAITGLADDDTWSGTPADRWMTDLRGHVNDALAALGEPLADAMSECRRNAQRMQAESARAATSGG